MAIRNPIAGHETASRRQPYPIWPGVVVGAALTALLGLVGCMQPQVRPQAADQGERDRYGVETIGDRTVVGNVGPRQIGILRAVLRRLLIEQVAD